MLRWKDVKNTFKRKSQIQSSVYGICKVCGYARIEIVGATSDHSDGLVGMVFGS